MKIVHLSTTDYGGAYRAADRINRSLNTLGNNSEIIVRTKADTNSNCTGYFTNSFGVLISKAKNVINLCLSKGIIVSDYLGTDISKSKIISDADVIVLHWVNSFISYNSVMELIKTRKKIIWVMHDMWLFTGGCHYSRNCNGYLSGCNNCPYSSSFIKKVVAYNFRKKKEIFNHSDIQFIAVSDWIKNQAIASTIVKETNIHTIYNPLNTDIFKPISKNGLKEKFGLPNKKIILFGADKATNNSTKGFKYIIDALSSLDGKKYAAVCFGNSPEKTRAFLPNIDIYYTGPINNDFQLSELYNSADVMITPSLQEAFGYTCCEALSCGTPVVAFNVGGLSEQIVHKTNGYLVTPKDVPDLVKGITYCIENHNFLSQNARQMVLNTNTLEIIGKKYMSMFE